MSEFNINNLYKQVFKQGRGLPFQRPEEPEMREGLPYPDTPGGAGEEGSEFMNMRNTIKSNMPDGRQVFMPVQIGTLVLPNEPTLDIRADKRILRTTITGNTTRRGTVKELIYTGDYEIFIRGIAINYETSRVYPEDIVKAINDLFLENTTQTIQCALTEILGVQEIVIEDIRFPNTPGQHAQAYEIRCYSDEPFELDIDA